MHPMSEGDAFLSAALLLLAESSAERQDRAETEAALEQTGTYYRSAQGSYYRLPDDTNVIETRLGKRYDCGPANDQLSPARKFRTT